MKIFYDKMITKLRNNLKLKPQKPAKNYNAMQNSIIIQTLKLFCRILKIKNYIIYSS